jgi:hypothetical protein
LNAAVEQSLCNDIEIRTESIQQFALGFLEICWNRSCIIVFSRIKESFGQPFAHQAAHQVSH